jgi:hypothetical protein
MSSDPDYYDCKIAGWWVWGLCQWIGSGWCSEEFYNGGEWKVRPHLNGTGMGINRPAQQRPHLSNAGMGINRPAQQRPHLSNAGRNELLAYFYALSDRLRSVRVCCGDWSRVLGDTPTFKNGTTGILLDPPYSAEADRDGMLYGVDDLSVAHDVREWAIEHGDNPQLRIALCGYDTEHAMPGNWMQYVWKAGGGYGSQGNGRGRGNAVREVIWFSPHCLPPAQARLL